MWTNFKYNQMPMQYYSKYLVHVLHIHAHTCYSKHFRTHVYLDVQCTGYTCVNK